MINVNLIRYFSDETCTLGVLKVLGMTHRPFYTMERPWVENMNNISCIPTGVYNCSPYSGTIFKDVYQVEGVPNRTAILLHPANYPHELAGCIAIGYGVAPQTPMISTSQAAVARFKALLCYNDFLLTIRDI